MPEQISKYPDVTLQVLKGAGAKCGEGAEQKILKQCPAERFCSLPTGEICVYGIDGIANMTQISPRFSMVALRFGYMESPNVPKAAVNIAGAKRNFLLILSPSNILHRAVVEEVRSCQTWRCLVKAATTASTPALKLLILSLETPSLCIIHVNNLGMRILLGIQTIR